MSISGVGTSRGSKFANKNYYTNTMYYAVIMDCDDGIYNTIGHNSYGTTEFTVTFLNDENHFSYEKQGVI